MEMSKFVKVRLAYHFNKIITFLYRVFFASFFLAYSVVKPHAHHHPFAYSTDLTLRYE